ncbi:hypothetical protein [Puia sp.]|jgi:hypothetical protein|uniref:hypothetical protein n=1 Tax=Puia sp. TaxID=2045100 RepID=UPI002F4282D2
MHILLLILYYILCAYGIARLRFIRKSGIKPALLQLLFAIHVATGWIHNAIAWRYYPGHGDVWDNFEKSFMYRHRLLSQFALWKSDNNTLTHITHNGIIYIQMLLNCFSLGSLAVNTLLFAFIVFLGNIALFRVFRQRFPDDPLTSFTVFLLPSVLFWTSCIHREAVLYLLMGFLLFNMHRLLTRGISLKHAFLGGLCLLGIAYFRIAFAIPLLPALFCWWVAAKRRARRKILLGGAITLILFILLILPLFDLPVIIARRQQEFMSLEGHSRLFLPTLNGSWSSLLAILPYALLNGLFQPLPGMGGQPVYFIFSLELLAIWGIVLFAILRTIRNRQNPMRLSKEPLITTFGLFCLVFALFGMLTVGMMIPFAGAIVRYRSIYLLFLLAPFLHSLRTLPLFQTLNERLHSYLSHKL